MRRWWTILLALGLLAAPAGARTIGEARKAAWLSVAHPGLGEYYNARWGPFFDPQVRQLTYDATADFAVGSTGEFAGVASFDGSNAAVTGQNQTQATSRVESLSRAPDGTIQLQLRGLTGRTYRIEVSTDLWQWTTLVTRTSQDGTLSFQDSAGSSGQPRFYRVVAE